MLDESIELCTVVLGVSVDKAHSLCFRNIVLNKLLCTVVDMLGVYCSHKATCRVVINKLYFTSLYDLDSISQLLCVLM